MDSAAGLWGRHERRSYDGEYRICLSGGKIRQSLEPFNIVSRLVDGHGWEPTLRLGINPAVWYKSPVAHVRGVFLAVRQNSSPA